DVLINNAGIAYVATMEEIRPEDLRRQMDTNFFAAMRLAQRVLPDMRARRQGWIVNMSSIGGRMVIPLFGPYSSSKFALEAASDAMRYELTGSGVRVILIEPQFIATNMQQAAADLSVAYRACEESGPYSRVYKGFRKMWSGVTRRPAATAEECAEIVLGALQSPKPRARYAVPDRGKWMLRMSAFFSDAMVDRRVARMFGLDRPADSN
ncbi:MAG: SDR family NAD(P)-dependent oxidoreductase, partial [Bryobacteraceae bacterium]